MVTPTHNLRLDKAAPLFPLGSEIKPAYPHTLHTMQSNNYIRTNHSSYIIIVINFSKTNAESHNYTYVRRHQVNEC